MIIVRCPWNNFRRGDLRKKSQRGQKGLLSRNTLKKSQRNMAAICVSRYVIIQNSLWHCACIKALKRCLWGPPWNNNTVSGHMPGQGQVYLPGAPWHRQTGDRMPTQTLEEDVIVWGYLGSYGEAANPHPTPTFDHGKLCLHPTGILPLFPWQQTIVWVSGMVRSSFLWLYFYVVWAWCPLWALECDKVVGVRQGRVSDGFCHTSTMA